MTVRLPVLVAAAILTCAVAANAVKPKPTPKPPPEEEVRQSLERIVIPKLEFRDASVRECLDFLSKEAQRLDPKKRGIPFHVRIEPSPAALAAYRRPEQVPGIPGDPAPTVPVPAVTPDPPLVPEAATITTSLINIPLIEALRYVTGLANLKFWIRRDGVHIVSMFEPEPMFTRDFRIPADFYGWRVPGWHESEDRVGTIKHDLRDSLIANGVAFPEGAAMIVNDDATRLTVHNTKDQFALISQFLEQGRRPATVPVPGPEVPKVTSGGKPWRSKRSPHAPPTAAEIEQDRIENLLDQVIIPKLDLQNASMEEALKFLGDQARELDPKGLGIRFRVKADPPRADVAAVPGLPFPIEVDPQKADSAEGSKITVNLTNIELREALRYVTGLSNRQFWVGADGVHVVSFEDRIPKTMFVREFLVPPGAERELIMHTFDEKTGFFPRNRPPEASAVYVAYKRQWIVRDTEKKLRETEAKLATRWREYYAAEKAKKKSR